MLRTLIHYWRVNLAVVAGAAVATAVLAGALMVGDSVRGSLLDLVLDRLGGVDEALVTERFFREELAVDVAGALEGGSVAPLILLRGAAVHADRLTRASRVSIHGIDSRFTELFGGVDLDFARGEGQIFPSVIVNESLRSELDASVGDALLLSFGRSSDVPRETLIGDKDPEDVLGTLRVTLVAVLPDEGLGRFGLSPRQQNPFNAFVSLEQLQRSVGRRGRVNGIVLGGVGDGGDSNATLRRALRLDDLGLDVREAPDHVVIESAEFVLRPDVDREVGEIAVKLETPLMRVQSYVANEMRVADRRLPYSLVAALDTHPGAAWSSLSLTDGRTAAPGPGEILLNTWAAEDLGAAPGDELELSYFVVGPREELQEERTTLRVAGVVTLNGLGGDPSLTPDYPGVQDAEDMAAWDPPFPVDLDRIRPKDERYWDDHGATPKAFVSLETGERLWSTRFGSTTSVRIGAQPGGDVPRTASMLERALLEQLPPESFGYVFRPIKQEGRRAAVGATDFAGLFVGFSFFLIVSAALLVGLLFGLGVEERAREVGLLLAVGFPVARVRRRLLAEGGALAVVGALAGSAAAVGYAWLMMAGLRSLWLPAVGSSQLYLHVQPLSLAWGWLIAVAVIGLSIMLAVRRLRRIPPPVLLAGSLEPPPRRRRRRIAPWLGTASLVLAIGLIAYASISGRLDSPGLAFGSGTLLLVAGLAFFAVWCRGAGRRRSLSGHRAAWAGMAARNSSWSPGRSILSVALVASACFVIVTVAANRHEFGDELRQKESGSGGFPLLAEADIPLHQDLNREPDRFELGFSPVDAETLAPCRVFPFRVLPGEDASCLNLYQPEKPRILGAPPELVERGGFTFARHLELPAEAHSPWDLLDTTFEDGAVPAIGDANSVQWILHLGLGRDLEIVDDLGETVRLRLVALLQTSIFQSELLISEEAFLEHFPGRTGYGYFLVEAPEGSEREVTRVLESGLGPFGFDITTTAERLASFKEVEHTYLSTFQMLGGLGLLLGTLGLAVVLFRNVIERRGELATLRAFGFRRASLAWMVLAENAFLLLVGIAIGSLSALAAVAPRLATIHVPWGSLAATLVSVAAVGMLASVVAVSGALRIPLLPALKAER